MNYLAISRQSTDSLMVAAFHESVHYLKEVDIDTYNSIVSDMKEFALNDDGFRDSHAGIVENIMKNSYSDYMSGDAQTDADFAEEEFTSSALSYLLFNENTIKKFAQADFNRFQRVVDNVIHVFEKNISMYEGRDKSVRDMYEPIIEKLKGHKKSIIQRYDDGISGTANDYEGVDKYSLIGIRADGIPVFKTDQTLKALPLSERKRLLSEELPNNFIGKTARFERNGHVYYAKFDDVDIRKNIYGDKKSDGVGYVTKINLGLSGDLFDLVEELDYDRFEFDRGKSNNSAHQNLHGWYYLFKTIQVDNGVYDVLANVRLSKNNNQYIYIYIYSIQLTENENVDSTTPREINNNVPVRDSAMNSRVGVHGIHSDSLLQNGGFENSQNNENSPADLGNINKNVNEKFSVPQGTIPESSKMQIDRILHRAGNRYGISDLSQDELSGVSLSQKDIDARLGREFMFDGDMLSPTDHKDMFNNSLHRSDSVIFKYGDGAEL